MNSQDPKNKENLTFFVAKFAVSISGSMNSLGIILIITHFGLMKQYSGHRRLILSNQSICSLAATLPSPPYYEHRPGLLPLLTQLRCQSELISCLFSSPTSPAPQIALIRMVSTTSPLPALIPAIATFLDRMKAHSTWHTS